MSAAHASSRKADVKDNEVRCGYVEQHRSFCVQKVIQLQLQLARPQKPPVSPSLPTCVGEANVKDIWGPPETASA